MTRGVPVSIEWMICGAYSFEGSSRGSGAPVARASLVAAYSPRFSSERETYSATQIRKRSICSSSRRNQGRYSEECSDDSVGK